MLIERDVPIMKLKAMLLPLVSIFILLCISSAFAITAYLSVSPKRIPQNGIVTIYVENKYETTTITVDKIEVIHDGTTYTKSLGVYLDPGDSVTEHFGTGVGGWDPPADTSQEGKYVVSVIGPFNVEDYFDVSDMFSVPEFSLPTLLVTAMSFALLLGVASRAKKNRI